MIFNVGYASLGKKDRPNEDRFRLLGCNSVVPDDRPCAFSDSGRGVVCGVFDGVGGAPMGGRAATYAAEALDRFYLDQEQAEAGELYKIIHAANQEVNQWGYMEGTSRSKGATTATVAWVYSNNLTVFHAGDSAAYLWSDETSTLSLLTRDHGDTKGINNYIGLGDGFNLDVIERPWSTNDILMLCTDGVTKGINRKDELADIIESYMGEPDLCANELATRAKFRGVNDDITAVVIEAE